MQEELPPTLTELLSGHFPPPFPACEGIIISYQKVKLINNLYLSERLDINCELIVEPNHAICSNPAIEI